jgi:hypothetical protein
MQEEAQLYNITTPYGLVSEISGYIETGTGSLLST